MQESVWPLVQRDRELLDIKSSLKERVLQCRGNVNLERELGPTLEAANAANHMRSISFAVKQQLLPASTATASGGSHSSTAHTSSSRVSSSANPSGGSSNRTTDGSIHMLPSVRPLSSGSSTAKAAMAGAAFANVADKAMGAAQQAAEDAAASAARAVAQASLTAAQQRWQALMVERLKAVQLLLPSVHLASAPRSEQELQQMRDEVADVEEAWQRIGSRGSPFTRDIAATNVSRLLYDATDVLEAIVTQQEGANAPQALIHAVKAPSRRWLQSFFADMQPDKRQVGLDDVLHHWFREEEVHRTQRLATAHSAAACRDAAKRGLPPSERPHVWACALGLQLYHSSSAGSDGSDSRDGTDSASISGGSGGHGAAVAAAISAMGAGKRGGAAAAAASAAAVSVRPLCHSVRDEAVLEALCEGMEGQPLLLDALSYGDVQEIADNEHYFVFEEGLRAMLFAFSRDMRHAEDCALPPLPRLAAEGRDGSLLRSYPPSGVLPFQGLAAFAAPLLYVYDHPAAAYRVFSAMYRRYWCRLHSLCVDGAPYSGSTALCKTFVELIEDLDPDVASHLEKVMGVSALEIAFPMMFSAFVGFLSPTETLLLWDRIIGFDSLLPLPVLAAAVMVFRRDLIMAAESADELIEVMEDLSQLKVVPLMQAVLFSS